MRPFYARSGPTTPGLVPQAARDRLAARIEAIQSRTPAAPAAPAEPVPDSPPPRTVAEGEAHLASVLPVASSDHWEALANGKWVHRETGLVEDAPPFGG